MGRETEVVPPEVVCSELATILASAEFVHARRSRDFLRFVVEETLAGRAGQLKGTTLALELFGRDASFDPQIDPIVRVEALRLRRRLGEYYSGSGRRDPVRIRLPKGSYVPIFAAHRNGGGTRPTVPDSEPSIAVLPFDNLSGDPACEPFCDGLTDEVMAALGRRGLTVVARHTALLYRKRAVDVRRLGLELGVGYVLEGGVRRAGSRVRVTARLIDTERGVHLWSETYDGNGAAGDEIGVQADVAKRAAAAIPEVLAGYT